MMSSQVAFSARVVLMVAASAIVIGSFGPWLNHRSGFGPLAMHGVDGYGALIALCGVLVAVFGAIRRSLGSVIVAALVSVVAVLTYLDARDRIVSFGDDYVGGSIGWGLYAVIGGGAVGSVAGGICSRHERTHGPA